MTFAQIIEERRKVLVSYADSLDSLVNLGIETDQERGYALKLADKIEDEVKKLVRDIRRQAMKDIPGEFDVE